MKSKEELAAEQAAFWNGPGGRMWLAAYARIQRSIAPFSEAVLAAAAPRPGERVLDIGCGTGTTTALIAEAVGPAGHVTGVDISQPLIETAQAQKLGNATFVVADAASHAFEAGTFDLLFSRFGVMFFGDPVGAFANLRRAMKPEGRLAFVCWRTPQENPWGLVPFRAAAPFFPPVERPGPEDPGQYSFGDRARVERILTAGGFGSLAIEPIDRPVMLGKDIAEVVDNQGRMGPLARLFAEAPLEQVAKAKAAIGEALKPYAAPDGVRLAGACWLVQAKAR